MACGLGDDGSVSTARCAASSSGRYFAGTRQPVEIAQTPARIENVTPVNAPLAIAETRVLDASAMRLEQPHRFAASRLVEALGLHIDAAEPEHGVEMFRVGFQRRPILGDRVLEISL